MNSDFTCGFIGLGLIGGSIARAIRQFYPKSRLMAFEINQDSLSAAADDGVIDTPLSAIGKELSDCDYIFSARLLRRITEILQSLRNALRPPAY